MTLRPLVCLAGWGMEARVWATCTTHLADRFSAVMHLAMPDGATCAARADALAPHVPPDAVVCAWSLGAMVSLELAVRHPDRVAGLALAGATPCFVSGPDWAFGLEPAVVEAFHADWSQDPARTARRFIALQVLGDQRRREVAAHLEQARQDVALHAPALGEGLRLLAQEDLRSRCPALHRPVLLIHGAQDALMPVGAARWLSDTLRAPLHLLPEAGHAPFLSDARAVAACIAERFGSG